MSGQVLKEEKCDDEMSSPVKLLNPMRKPKSLNQDNEVDRELVEITESVGISKKRIKFNSNQIISQSKLNNGQECLFLTEKQMKF